LHQGKTNRVTWSYGVVEPQDVGAGGVAEDADDARHGR
jgi:hypothetical protein